MKLNNAQIDTSQIYEQYSKGTSYLDYLGLTRNIPIWVDLFEGRQWSKASDFNKSFPRPVFNITKKIIENQISNVNSAPVHLNYIADNDKNSTDEFTRFAEYQQKEMEQDALDDKAVEDSEIKGIGVYHYYWDSKAIGKKGRYEGALRGQIIDPLSIRFADPTETSVQKQEYIILSSREHVDTMKELCDKEEYKDLIEPDDIDTNYATHYEAEGSNLVTVYTKYFKKDGEVYFQKATKATIIHEPRALNPLINYEYLKRLKDTEHKGELDIDSKPSNLPDNKLEQNEIDAQYKASFYPIAILVLNPRDGSIYGLSDVDSIKEVQKCINQQYGMNTLAVQLNGSSRIVVKKGALKNGKQITNKVGEVIEDNTPTGTQGIYTLQVNPLSASAMEMPERMADFTRNIMNAGDIVTGDMVSKDLSGTAIAQLQAQSDKPIAQKRKRFWRCKEQIGKILEMFYKLFYENKEYTFDVSPMQRYQAQATSKPINDVNHAIFTGAKYFDTQFNIVVEAGQGTQYSEIQQMSFLNNALQSGCIDFATYLDLFPDKAMPDKSKLKSALQAREQSEIVQLRNGMQQMQSENQQLSDYIKQQSSAIKELSRQLDTSNRVNGDIQNEANQKITKLNKTVVDLYQKLLNKDTTDNKTIAPKKAENMTKMGASQEENSISTDSQVE